MSRFTISGHVISRQNQAPVPGLRVEAWDKDLFFPDLVGSGFTDAVGRFEISFEEKYYRELFADKHPDLYFKVFDGLEQISSTEKEVLWNYTGSGDPIKILVDKAGTFPVDGGDLDAFLVRGTVRNPDGSPLVNAVVKAYDRDLRSEQILGESSPGTNGQYLIAYTAEQFLRAEKDGADLVVRLYDASGKVLAQSETIFNAREMEVVNLIAGQGLWKDISEFRALGELLLPLIEDVKPEALTPDDVSFLSGETEKDRSLIATWVDAFRIGTEAKLAVELVYGLLRSGLPADLDALVVVSEAAKRNALATSVAAGVIAPQSDETIEAFLRALDALEPKQPEMLIAPEVLFSPVGDLSGANPVAEALVAARLNARLRDMIGEALTPLSDDLHAAMVRLIHSFQYSKLRDRVFQDVLLQDVLGVLQKNGAFQAEIARVAERLQRQPILETVGEVLELGLPLRDHEAFRVDLNRAKIFAFTQSANVNVAAAKQLLASGLKTDDIHAASLQTLVDRQTISVEEKDRLLLGFEVARLGGDNQSLHQAIVQNQVGDSLALAAWSAKDWATFLQRQNVSLLPGESVESYAANIFGNVERSLPTQVLLHRVTSIDQFQKIGRFGALEALFRHNQVLIDGNEPAAIDWSGVSTDLRPGLEATLQEASAFANTYRHMGVAEVINNKDLDAQGKAAALNRKLRAVQTFFTNNKALDFREADFFGQQGIVWDGIDEGEQPMVRKQMMAYQRTLSLAGDTDSKEVLLAKGMDSAYAIAAGTQEAFMYKTGLSQDKAESIYANASEGLSFTSHGFNAIQDAVMGGFGSLGVSNLDGKLVNDLRKIDGWETLFGPQDFCECEHCKSIFSPAAYFTDLMYFIRQHISKPVFETTGLSLHPLHLKQRRGDLWKLQLTCENTNGLVPYLTIVNEVLENYLNAAVGDVWQKLADPNEKISFSLPFHLHLEELRIYLEHFGKRPYDVYTHLKAPDAKRWRARLNLSTEELNVITQPDLANVALRYGNPATFTNWNVKELIRVAGISRQDFDDLRAMGSEPDLANITIVKGAALDGLQNYPELLQGLTNARLDKLHRLIRLWKKTGLTIDELDDLIEAVVAAGLGNATIDPNLVNALGQLLELGTLLRFKPQELCVLVHLLPVSASFPVPPAKKADAKLYERVFDLKRIFGESDPNTHAVNLSTTFYHYSQNTNNPADKTIDPRTPAVLGGLGISETDLLLLCGLLKTELPFDADGKCTLNRSNLSLLYRHAKIARTLRYSIPDFLIVLDLLFDTLHQTVKTLDQVQALKEFADWQKRSPFSLQELLFIIRGQESANLRFASDATKAALVVKDAQATAEGTAVEALKSALSRSFGVSLAHATAVWHWVATDVDGAGIATAAVTTFDSDGNPLQPADLVPLVALMRETERAMSIFSNLKFKEESVLWVDANVSVFDIANRKAVALDDLRELHAFSKQQVLNADEVAGLRTALQDKAANGTFSAASIKALSLFWGGDAPLIDSVVQSVVLPAKAFLAVQYLWDTLVLCQSLGINGYSLALLGKDANTAEQKAASEVALGAFNSRYADETVRTTKLEPYLDKVNMRKRDALCDYIVARVADFKFSDRNELYSFFLLDVEMGGCMRTSRVVAANGSLQLYVQRCLLNLEQSDPDLNPNIVDAKVLPSMVPTDEWEWRKNYRVWEANRKVFLYPENYIEPDLRDNKTPIFKDLEDELLQQKITQKAAEAAYKKYLSQFSELAHMVTAGSFYDSASDTYYFFAHTRQEPPQYHYRKWIGQKEWTPWIKIEVGVNSSHLQGLVFRGTLYIFWMETKAMEKSHFSGGSSSIDGYEYEVKLCYSSLNENGKWAATQRLVWFDLMKNDNVAISETVFADIFQGKKIHLFYSDKYLTVGLGTSQSLDLFYNDLAPKEFGIPWPSQFLTPMGEKMLAKGGSNSSTYLRMYNWHDGAGRNESAIDNKLSDYSNEGDQVSTGVNASKVPFDLDCVGLRAGDFVLKVGEHQILLRKEPYGKSGGMWNGTYWEAYPAEVKRGHLLSTSLPDTLGQTLMEEGLLALFSLQTQELTETPPPITFTEPLRLEGPMIDPDHVDFHGPWGEYYRELYFHIPFLIGHHLNATQKFKESKWWYERIFDPTAADDPTRDILPGDRNWRYIEFRNLAHQNMKAILSDDDAIAKYKSDPFNPHAIARLRLSAYQKTIVMHYIDNLLDWADALFTQDTMESTNEAGMLYILAAQILGKRPAKLGKCEGGKDSEMVYPVLEAAIEKSNEFLLYLENFVLGIKGKKKAKKRVQSHGRATNLDVREDFIGFAQNAFDLGAEGYSDVRFASYDYAKVVGIVAENYREKPSRVAPERQVVQQRLAFCIPPNKDLLGYWDRVEDRLFKLRNCLNISGVRRVLSLFAPEIDPRALVKAVAGGLSLEDALAALSPPLPNYRFSYLLERTRQFLGTVQGFGSALLSALEKKDVEELTLLRSVHERNILRLTTEIKKTNIKEANFNFAALQYQRANVENRVNYYNGLIEAGLTGNEITQQVTKHVATGLKTAEGVLHLLGAIFKLLPQIGSPFAMKYGGVELGSSSDSWAAWLASMAGVFDAISASAGLEATFQRREQEWNHQLNLAKTELKQMDIQLQATELRIAIAEKDLEIHEASIEQADELHEFYKNKFTNLGLYNYLAGSLTKLYRQSFNLALDLAKLTEHAFQFERDSSDIFVQNDNWQGDRAGLLAGERLSVQLMQMEKAWIIQNSRELEMTQSFSMAFWNPDQLVALRQTGTATFSIPEIAYDLFYPGQYRRKIKSVRLTVPCVVGPFTNVSAKLSLTGSKMRLEANGNLDAMPSLAVETSRIATSTAQNDGGQFDLSFRDERFLPFEGAGAVSDWLLELPSALQIFDYDTIGDVIVHISYTAKEDGLLRTNVENGIKTAVEDYTNDLPVYRLFSLRHEFPNAFHQLLHPTGANQVCSFEVKALHFNHLLRNAEITAGDTTIYLKPYGTEAVATTPATLKLKGVTAGSFGPSTVDAALLESSASLSGLAVGNWTLDAGADGLDPAELEDILLLVKYTAAFV